MLGEGEGHPSQQHYNNQGGAGGGVAIKKCDNTTKPWGRCGCRSYNNLGTFPSGFENLNNQNPFTPSRRRNPN
ncbi:hypothetical protein SESBI_05826 [Sesbania bispinosa]|nr:hypothetical protein SESBI_05826 [Sesbania bispinosa]